MSGHWAADVPTVSSYVDAYGKTEAEARAYLRNVLGYARLPKGTVLVPYEHTPIPHWQTGRDSPWGVD